jgi:putative flippase GtrA
MERFPSWRDYGLAFIGGALIVLFLSVVVKNLKISLPLPLSVWAAAMPLGAMAGIWIAGIVAARVNPIFAQLAKFSVTGFLNYSVDLGILNSLILLTGNTSDVALIGFRVVSAAMAVSNSFGWNRWWTFAKPEAERGGVLHEYVKFVGASLIGITVNFGVYFIIVILMEPPAGLSIERWANIGTVVGATVGLAFNFISYKKFVFNS